MLTYISIITLDNPYLLLGCDKFTHYREYSPSKFRYIAIPVEYLLYFRCDREYHFAGTLVSFTCFVPKKTQLFAVLWVRMYRLTSSSVRASNCKSRHRKASAKTR